MRKADDPSEPIRFWPLLEDMPELSHWPDRSQPFDHARSEVIAHIIERFGVSLDLAVRIFHYAKSKKVIRFNRDTRLWCGAKGGGA